MKGRQDEKQRVLVVDDLPENIQILMDFLKPRGYEVISASNGEEALQEGATQPPDVILLDLMMPKMDGFEVCRHLKEAVSTRHIPVIIVTGLAQREANVRALEAGADDFLVKPFDAVLLGARIRSSLRSKALQDQLIDYQRQLEEINRTLEQRIVARTEQVTRTQQVAVFSLAKLAESRDTETGAHLERIRLYAREIALRLMQRNEYPDITPEFVERLFVSSPLHDIGKVGIPDRILLKPGKLTPDEFEVMKLHTVIGGDTLRAAYLEAGSDSFLEMGHDVANSHHERWDGKGYPNGLKGDEIPLAARIVSVSDVYDALTSKRPYKEPFSHETSRSIVIEGRGAAFDPAVVDAFLACEDRICEIHEQFSGVEESAWLVKLDQALDAKQAQSEGAV